MAWSELDSAANAGASASGSSISVSRTYTGGERAVVWVTAGGATTITVTDGTNTYTQVGSQVVASSGDVQAVFECLSCTAGTFTVQANFGTANAFRGIAVHRFSGLTGSGSLVGQAQTAPGTGADGLTSTNLTPASQPALLLGISTDYNGTTVNVGTGFTSSAVYTNVDTANGSYTVSETKRLTSTSAVAATFTATSSPQNFVTLAYWAAEPVNPAITGVSTMTPRQGESFTITGTNFGATQGSGYVALGGATQYTTLSWSDTSITVVVDRATNKYGGPVNVSVIDTALNTSAPYALTALLPQTGWDYVDIGTPNTTVANRITASPDIASGDQVAYDTVGGTVTVYSDGTFSVSSGTTSFNAEVWTSPDGWGGYGLQTISTWNMTGTGPRVYPGLGAPYGAGSYGAWVRNIAGSGSTVTQAGAAASSGQASGAVVVAARGESYSNGQAGGAFRTTVVVAGVSGVSSQTPANTAVRAAGESHVASQAQGGTVIAVVSAGASSSSNQASGAVTVLANAAAHALAQAAAFSQIIARGETGGSAQAPAGVAWAAAGASQAISQTEGAAQSNAANATAGAAHSLAQAAAAVVVAAAGVSYSSSQAASGAAYAVAVPGESAASSGGAGGSTVLARGESAGNAAAAEGSLVATVVVPGVSQAASQAAGIGSDGSVVVSTHDACVGFIVNMGRLMHR